MNTLALFSTFLVLVQSFTPSFFDSASDICPRFICSDSFQAPNGCLKIESEKPNNVILRACKTPTDVCEISSLSEENTCVGTDKLTVAHLYPGEVCSADSECFSKSCKGSQLDPTTKICMGSLGACSDSIDCHAGYYCFNRTCVSVSTKDQTCSLDFSNCSAITTCSNTGKCILLGSLPLGANSYNHAACETYYFRNNICAKAPKLVTAKLKKEADAYLCPASENPVCEYESEAANQKVVTQEKCSCGLSDYSGKYCKLGRGDANIKDYFDYVKYLQENKLEKMCHINKGPLCIFRKLESMPSGFCKAYIAYSEMINMAMYYNNSKCVKEVLNKVYWHCKELQGDEPKQESQTVVAILIVAIVIVFFAMLLMLIGYYKRVGKLPVETNTHEDKPIEYVSLPPAQEKTEGEKKEAKA